MFNEIFNIVQEIDNSKGLEAVVSAAQQIQGLVNLVNANEIKERNLKNALIDSLIVILQSHKDKVSNGQANQ